MKLFLQRTRLPPYTNRAQNKKADFRSPTMCKMKAHTTPEAVLAGVIIADDRAGNDLADASCKLGGEAFGQPGRHMHGSLDPARWFCETAFGQ